MPTPIPTHRATPQVGEGKAMTYTQLKVKAEYRDKLKTLADKEHRSMANMLEVLIDRAEARLNLEEVIK